MLSERGPLTIAELVATIEQEGFTLSGRPSKAISDTLRWEVALGRVDKLGRGHYGPGTVPRQTRSWIGQPAVGLLRATGRAEPWTSPIQTIPPANVTATIEQIHPFVAMTLDNGNSCTHLVASPPPSQNSVPLWQPPPPPPPHGGTWR